MKWFTLKTKRNRIYEKSKWHRWFAWHPVTIKIHEPEGVYEKVWLEWIQRCGTLHTWGFDIYWIWEYRREQKGHLV